MFDTDKQLDEAAQQIVDSDKEIIQEVVKSFPKMRVNFNCTGINGEPVIEFDGWVSVYPVHGVRKSIAREIPCVKWQLTATVCIPHPYDPDEYDYENVGEPTFDLSKAVCEAIAFIAKNEAQNVYHAIGAAKQYEEEKV